MSVPAYEFVSLDSNEVFLIFRSSIVDTFKAVCVAVDPISSAEQTNVRASEREKKKRKLCCSLLPIVFLPSSALVRSFSANTFRLLCALGKEMTATKAAFRVN